MPESKWLLALVVVFAVGTANADWKDWLKSTLESETSQSASTTTSGLTEPQIVEGLKEALAVGTRKAVNLLGKPGGYLDDQQVKIPIPDSLSPIASGLRSIGQDKLVDQFIETINQAAERAVPETVNIFADSIREMSWQDARNILDGSDTAATDYFRSNNSARLTEAILPIVKQATQEVGVTSAYKSLISRAGFMADYVNLDSLDLDKHITAKALDGLFVKLAEQEQLIRKDPVARTTDILKTVFGR